MDVERRDRHRLAMLTFGFMQRPATANVSENRGTRPMCYRCFWPKALCWCASIRPIHTRTKFLILMHPKEFKREKAATGRLTHLCLANSEIHMGVGFDDVVEVQRWIKDPGYFPVLAYPGRDALNFSTGGLVTDALGDRNLLVLLLDATWTGARKMLHVSPSLQRLPRVMFNAGATSRFVIKQQPQVGCLSTLETAHELLIALDRSGLDRYSDPAQLLGLFDRMQDFQIRCAADPSRGGYRRHPYGKPADRVATTGRKGKRRNKYLPVLP
jgi:DTW domain-containing protein